MSKLEIHGITDVGRKRSHNEDSIGTDASLGLAIVADGMGGHNAGEVASSMAVDVVMRILRERLPKIEKEAELDEATGLTQESALLRHAIMAANDAIYEAAQIRPECRGMGTTIVAALFYGNRLSAANVGDSRMYRLRKDVLSHITEDHSLVQEQVRRGLLTADDARASTMKNLVTKALGVEPGVEPDIVEDVFQAGDIYLLCSDGLTDVVPDEAIRLTLVEFGRDLKRAAEHLVMLANDAGGPDNISVVLVRTPERVHRKAGLWSRLFGR